ncbi:intersectin-1-like [Halichondria panicea]|uniref:intersectin-1-like n=1 Tax=Halichondria panicea TaxID=6063 RepID=UPI00312BA4ED
MSGPEAVQRQKALHRYIAAWDFVPTEEDELKLTRGDILLVADEFDDGWMRGIRLIDLEIGFFPTSFVIQDTSPVYKLKEIKLSTEHYISDPKFIEYDSSKRSKIALEIFTSEEAYLNKLKSLNETFIVPLADNPNVISPEYYGPIFSNIQPLVSLSSSLVTQLKSRMAAWDERFTLIGDIFMHMGHHLKLFVTYAVQHTLGSQMLTKLMGQEKFKSWLEKTEIDLQRTLNSLLLEPIQRVPRYELLLKDLLKHTPEEHPDYSTLKEALNFVQKIAIDCNENIRRAENEFKLFTITKRFPHDDVELVTVKNNIRHRDKTNRTDNGLVRRKPKRQSVECINEENTLSARSFFESEHHRVFIKEGTALKAKTDFSDPSERYLFMCSDVILISQPSSRSRKTFRLKERVMLVHAWVTDTASIMTTNGGKVPERGFILGTPRRIYHFLAANVGEKNSWFQELQTHIFKQKRLFNRLLSHLSIPDETYHSLKVKSKVGYLGMLQDELSFKAGDEVSVIGFQNGTGKWRPGLYSHEPFDPSTEWYFGVLNGNFGWFPIQCANGVENISKQNLEPLSQELEQTPMCTVLGLKQRMLELTGREVLPLMENERVVKVFVGEGNFKTLRIPPQCTVDDIVRMYFKVKPDSQLAWNLIEQSIDNTVHRPLDVTEDPSEVIDFWGKSKDQMRFLLKQSIISHGIGESEA